jgi:hypothetical protein
MNSAINNHTDTCRKYRNVPVMQGKFFACKKCDYRNKDARNDLEKIQLVKYAKLSLFIIIEGCAIADIPNLSKNWEILFLAPSSTCA